MWNLLFFCIPTVHRESEKFVVFGAAGGFGGGEPGGDKLVVKVKGFARKKLNLELVSGDRVPQGFFPLKLRGDKLLDRYSGVFGGVGSVGCCFKRFLEKIEEGMNWFSR